MSVLVTGGTGLLGRSVVERLTSAGHSVRVLSRSAPTGPAAAGVEMVRGDLRDAPSLETAVSSIDVVVHCASDVSSPGEVDVAGTANLLAAIREAGVAHVAYVSIVGVDRVPLAFYRAKMEVESMIGNQSVPWTIQRATQFHPFIDSMLTRQTRLPLLALPRGLRFQPIAVPDVADRLVQHVDAGPAGRAPDIGGPEVLPLKELATPWLRARRRHRLLVPVPLPGRLGQAFRNGANLCPDQASQGTTWQQYLDAVHGPQGVP